MRNVNVLSQTGVTIVLFVGPVFSRWITTVLGKYMYIYIVEQYQKPKQGSHRLEMYLNLGGYLEKTLKNKYALKSTGKSSK